MRLGPFLAAIALVLATGSAQAVPLSVSFVDPIGDFANESIDLVGMTLDFDNATGGYTLTVRFDAANPFSGGFNVNANLLNGDIAPLTTDPAFVGINESPIVVGSVTELSFVGTDTRLTSWNEGDTIANSDTIFGLPIDATFTAFVSGVQDGGAGIDLLDAASAVVVPEPATLWLVVAGLLGVGLVSRSGASGRA